MHCVNQVHHRRIFNLVRPHTLRHAWCWIQLVVMFENNACKKDTPSTSRLSCAHLRTPLPCSHHVLKSLTSYGRHPEPLCYAFLLTSNRNPFQLSPFSCSSLLESQHAQHTFCRTKMHLQNTQSSSQNLEQLQDPNPRPAMRICQQITNRNTSSNSVI